MDDDDDKKRHPYLPRGQEWSRWLSTSQAGDYLGRSGGAIRKQITSRANGADQVEVAGQMQAKKFGRLWQVRLHRSFF